MPWYSVTATAELAVFAADPITALRFARASATAGLVGGAAEEYEWEVRGAGLADDTSTFPARAGVAGVAAADNQRKDGPR